MTHRSLPIMVLACLALLVTAWPVASQTNVASPDPDRYLLVFDISAPMRLRAGATQNAVTGMLVSGMHGQLRDGDQIGIWTYNDELHTGEIELIKWKESERNEITRKVLEFLKTRQYEHSTRFETVRPELLSLIQESKRVTVILLCDGDEVIQGTPYDLMIQRYFQENAKDLAERKVPAILVLRGYKGEFVGHKITYAPWPVEFPPFPVEPEPSIESTPTNAATTQTSDLSKTLVTTNRGPVVFAEPLIVRGESRSKTGTQVPGTNTTLVEPSSLVQSQANILPATNIEIRTLTNQPAENLATENPPPATVGSEKTAESPASTSTESDDSSFWSPMKLTMLGVLGLLVVVGTLLLRKQPRSRGQSSLITRSMSKRKPRR